MLRLTGNTFCRRFTDTDLNFFNSASALAANSFARSSFAAAFPVRNSCANVVSMPTSTYFLETCSGRSLRGEFCMIVFCVGGQC